MATMKAVAYVVDERGDGHGWWYHLKPGWKREGYNTHTLRADTRQAINRQLRHEVVPCTCDACWQAKSDER